jgi:hypothetical protein
VIGDSFVRFEEKVRHVQKCTQNQALLGESAIRA